MTMKRLWLIGLSLLLIAGMSACSPDDDSPTPETPEQPDNNNNSGGNGNSGENNTSMNLQIKIGSSTFPATLQNNATATAFKAMLPMTINMSELNNNEKYFYLPGNLPTASSNPGTIHNGDIMLYGSNCLVLFYKTFSTSYSYTRIGVVDNPSGFESALGSGSVSVTFELVE